MRRRWLSCVLIFSICLLGVPIALAAENSDEIAIIFGVDVSGSMEMIADPQSYWIDAIAVGLDLAPDNSQVAYLAVNTGVVVQTDFYNSSYARNRNHIKDIVLDTPIRGSTDFNVVLETALSMFESQDLAQRHLIFLADFSEGGFLGQERTLAQSAQTLTELTEQFADSNIRVHLLFLETPTQNQNMVPLWEALAYETRGSVNFIENPQDLSNVVQSIYFDIFDFEKSTASIINTTDLPKEVPITLPDFEFRRKRIHVFSTAPMEGIQIHVDSGQISFNETRHHAMVELTYPVPEALTLVLPPNDGAEISIYTIIDGAVAEYEYIPYEPYEPVQPAPEVIVPVLPELAPVESYRINPVVLISTIAGLAIAVALIIFFLHIRPKQTAAKAQVVQLDSNFEFTGKLNIYVTNTPDDLDIPPQTFDLFRLGGKREISLEAVLEKCKIADLFPGVEGLRFVAKKRGLLQVINESECTVLLGMRLLEKGQGHTLEYGEKLHITCCDEVSEMEVHYKSVKPSEQTIKPNPMIRYAD